MKNYVMDIHEIVKYLPHRYPFLLIDRVLELDLGKSITAIKNVTINEEFFTGHFPERPVMPGVLMLEAMAQAGGILAYKSTNTFPDSQSLYYFAAVDNVRFRRIVEPGDQLIIKVQLVKHKLDLWKLEGLVYVGDELACSAEFMCIKKEVEGKNGDS